MPLTDPTLQTDVTLLTDAAESAPAVAVEVRSRPPIQVLVGGRDLTNRVDSLVFSAVDNGGFEIATLGLPSVDRPTKGTPVTIRYGLEVAWGGRVAEISDHSQHDRATKTTGCEGWQAALKDNPYQMIYVDRDLSQWHQPGLARSAVLTNAFFAMGSTKISPGDPPGLVQQLEGAWSEPWRPLVESWYDAGPGNLIAAIYYALTTSSAGFVEALALCDDDNATGERGTGNISPSSTAFFSAVPARYAFLQHLFIATNAGTPGASYQAYWKDLAVYGPSGLPGRGDTPQGFYPSDIARHAINQVPGIQVGTIVDSIDYIAPQVVYRTPTDADVVIEDMAKLLGWTWGVWEPPGIFSDEPRLDFRPPPPDATAVVAKAECDELDITSRLGELYDTAIVSYTDAGGGPGQVTVTLPNPQLYEAGITGRTLSLNAGVSEEGPARLLGLDALKLSQVAARAAGQATLPAYVKLPGGGSKPAALLRPGIDRLRITDLVDGGPLFEQGTTRRDVFRISRIETSIGSDGVTSTRVELDSGTNLLDALTARLALAAGVVGAGASG